MEKTSTNPPRDKEIIALQRAEAAARRRANRERVDVEPELAEMCARETGTEYTGGSYDYREPMGYDPSKGRSPILDTADHRPIDPRDAAHYNQELARIAKISITRRLSAPIQHMPPFIPRGII